MRRVYDDTMFSQMTIDASEALLYAKANKKEFSDYGRESVSKISAHVFGWLNEYGFPCIKGKNEHAYGIGNNNAIEVIYTGDEHEQQICGLLHLTDDMYGNVICWTSDIDGKRSSKSITIRHA